MRVARTVRVIDPKDDDRSGRKDLSLADFRSDRCYILIGDPGIGKTTAFEEEAAAGGAGAPIVSARRFLSGNADFSVNHGSEPLFIDGFDEVRSVGSDPRRVSDTLVNKLWTRGCPRFRLSCRTGRWLGKHDREALSSLDGYANLVVLELNPLTPIDVRQIVASHGVEAVEFVSEAFENGLESLLWNPQLLDVLLKSTGLSGWPASPTEAFEFACKEWAKEHSKGYRVAQTSDVRPPRDAVIDAAGRLSALMLIAGKGGWTAPDSDDADILSLAEVDERDALLASLNSALFRGPAKRREPAHRRIAEYLGARYLDSRIRAKNGVSARRVQALVLGHDGIPLQDLRGLSGWLAALNADVRQVLIQKDPMAIVCYGDTSTFSKHECEALLECLEPRISIESEWIPAGVVASLVGQLGMSTIWTLIAESNRSNARQKLVLYLIRGALQLFTTGIEARRKEAVGDRGRDRVELLKVVHDTTWWPSIRCAALESLASLLTCQATRKATLQNIVAGIVAGRLRDEDFRLISKLLDIMYPNDVSPSEVWAYLDVQPSAVVTAQVHFKKSWNRVVHRSSAKQVRALLDSLCDQASTLIPKLAGHRIGSDVVMTLLNRGLNHFGKGMEIANLYRWFDLVTFDLAAKQLVIAVGSKAEYNVADPDSNKKIRSWLDSHRQIQRNLVEYGLQQQEPKPVARSLMQTIGYKFIGQRAPEGFRRWCLERALELSDCQSNVASKLAAWSTFQNDGWGKPLPDADVARAVSGCPVLSQWNHGRLKANERIRRMEADDKKRFAKDLTVFEERKQAWLKALRTNIEALKTGTCAPDLLYELAGWYMDGLGGSVPRGSPLEPLAAALDGDSALLDATLSGFRSLLDRDDLPDLAEMAKMLERNRRSLFARPFLAGIEEEERMGGQPLARLGQTGRRRAIGFYLLTPLPRPQHVLGSIGLRSPRPDWVERALTKHPQAVADAVVAVHIARVRIKDSPIPILFDMIMEAEFDHVRPLAVHRMFSAFPSRCTAPQVDSLRLTLAAALCKSGMLARRLRALVTRRLRRKGMDVAQRAHWLCAGLFVAREASLSALEDYLASGGEVRVWNVVKCMELFGKATQFKPDYSLWKPEELASVIRALGARIRPPKPKLRAGFLTDKEVAELHFDSLMHLWVQELALRTDDVACRELGSLAGNSGLETWDQNLKRAVLQQAQRRRDDRHRAPTLKQIKMTLRGGPPSGAADLQALLIDTFGRLAKRIRHGQTDDWQQYWVKCEEKWVPRREDECRDRLLSDLQLLLKHHDVDAHKEGYYAKNKRADIRVAYRAEMAIPVEIKRNLAKDLWKAATDQLATKYMRAPESEGFGIYLVLWFGRSYTKRVPPQGCKPKSPREMREMIKELLPEERLARIAVIVVDVSRSDSTS